MENSNVNHPSHYNQAGKKECIVEMYEKFGKLAVVIFCALNTYKYRYREGHKDDAAQDESKANWYVTYALSMFAKNWLVKVICLILFPRIFKYINKR